LLRRLLWEREGGAEEGEDSGEEGRVSGAGTFPGLPHQALRLLAVAVEAAASDDFLPPHKSEEGGEDELKSC